MKTHILAAAALVAALSCATVALADTPQQTAQVPVTQIAQGATTTCTPAADPAIPLALQLTATIIQPLAAPPVFGASNRGACIGTPQYAPASQPFLSSYPYPAAWYVFGAFPAQQYRGN
jgi:hypothetical protein